MTSSVLFNKAGYDPFIDFLKAYSILCVVIAHCMQIVPFEGVTFAIWGGMQVPMFTLIQVFHSYKHERKPKLEIRKLWNRIVFPFLVSQVIIFLVYSMTRPLPLVQLCKNFVGGGGFGPGSYYIWIYLQISALLVLLYPVVNKMAIGQLLFVFVILSILCEVCCSLIHLPEWVYRLLAIRYLFLIPLGIKWVREGVNMNTKSVFLSLISIIAVLFFSYTDYNLEPFFFDTGWKTHRWICYYYVSTLLTFILYRVYISIHNERISRDISQIGQASYEIFLLQMVLFAIWPGEWIIAMTNKTTGLLIQVFVVFMGSIYGGWLIWKIKQTR